MSNEEKLKKCPFCGGEAIVIPYLSCCETDRYHGDKVIRIISSHKVECTKCYAQTREHITKIVMDPNGNTSILVNGCKTAIMEWNRRSGDD